MGQCVECGTEFVPKNSVQKYCSDKCNMTAYNKRSGYMVRRKRRIERKRQVIEEMGGECAECGVVGPPCIYDFHHEDPSEKESSVSQLAGYSLKRIREEAKKCTLLCANCHRIKHYGEE